MSPIGSSVSVSSPRKACRRRARIAPRVWMPTIARALGIGVLLGDLVGDPPQRSPQIVVLEHDLLTHSFASFLASRDRVKGRRAA